MYTRKQLRVITFLKRSYWMLLALVTACGLAASSQATDLINDTWLDSDRTDPAPPIYAENDGMVGIDADLDGNLESAWFRGGAGVLVASPGDLAMTNGATSSSFTTHLTPEATPITLTNPGDMLKLSWVFTPRGVTASGTSQGFRLALVDSPSSSRLTNDASPGSALYTGYGMFMNMKSGNLGNGNSFQLMERVAVSSAFLSASGAWVGLTNGADTTTPGYASDTQYTFVMTLTRNASSGLDITATMSGTGLGSTGSLAVAFTDTTPNSFTYDTFGLRPATAADTANVFDTSLFKVEFIPEPSTLTLAAVGLGLMIASIRRRRRW